MSLSLLTHCCWQLCCHLTKQVGVMLVFQLRLSSLMCFQHHCCHLPKQMTWLEWVVSFTIALLGTMGSWLLSRVFRVETRAVEQGSNRGCTSERCSFLTILRCQNLLFYCSARLQTKERMGVCWHSRKWWWWKGSLRAMSCFLITDYYDNLICITNHRSWSLLCDPHFFGSYNLYEPKKCGSQRSDQLLWFVIKIRLS